VTRGAILLAILVVGAFPLNAGADIVVHAPPSLSASARRIESIDLAALAAALAHAGLELPDRVEITLIPDQDPRAARVPDWIAGLAAAGSIVIFPERVLSYPYDSLESVVRHEITHLALDARAGDAPLPRWFHEGVAVSVDSGWGAGGQFRLLLAMFGRPDIAELTRLFTSPSRSETTQAYLLSAVLVHDVRRRHGPGVPGAIARRVAEGVPFDRAFEIETGEGPDAAAAASWATYRRWTAWVPAVTSASAAWTLILLLAFLAFAVQRRRRARRRRRWDEEEGGATF
jgi:hypothetical protein